MGCEWAWPPLDARRMSSAEIATQEQLLDIFPKIRIPGRAQGLNTVQTL